jgi:hypothetical protein
VTAIEQLRTELGKYTPEELQAQFTPAELNEINNTLIDIRCAERVASFDSGPLFWLTSGLTRTENPQYEAQGLPFRAPLPRKGYLVPLFNAFLAVSAEHPLFIPKSRTMLTSLSSQAYGTWAAQWHGMQTLVQTLNEDRCILLMSYVHNYYDLQPDWLKARHPLKRKSAFSVEWANGGEVCCIPSGAEKSRGYHSTYYIQDESAWIVDGEQCLAAVKPSGAKIICISSAAPGWFADECER